MLNKGITKVKQLIESPTHFLTHSTFQTRYGRNLCPLIYLGIVSSVKSLAKTLKLSDSTNTKKDHIEEIINSQKPTKKANNYIIAQKSVAATETHLKWQTDISSRIKGCTHKLEGSLPTSFRNNKKHKTN